MRPSAPARGAVLAGLLTLLAALSCAHFDPPNETCDPRRLDANRDQGEAADGPCSRCLEDRCCDRVGACDNGGACAGIVHAAHACVIAEPLAGARREEECAAAAGLAANPEANAAYRCMRDACGRECGLPVCKVAPAAVLIQDGPCDGCFSGSCCEQLNACYGSRACKLTVECMVRACGTQLGEALAAATRAGALPPADAAAGADTDAAAPGAPLCAGAGMTSELAVPSCVRACLCEFRSNDQGLPPEDLEQQPLTLALRVFECGVKAGCGAFCGADAAR